MIVFRLSVGFFCVVLVVALGCGTPVEPPSDDTVPAASAPPTATTEVTVVEPEEPRGIDPPATTLNGLPEPMPETQDPAVTVPMDDPEEPTGAMVDLAIAISGSDREARQAAIQEVELSGETGLQQMRTLLEHSTVEVRQGAMFYLLDRFDPTDADTRVALIAALSDDDALVRSLTISAMRRLGPNGFDSAVDALVERLADEKEEANNRASVARLLGGLESDSPSTIAAAIAGLADAVQADPDRSVRSAALMSLAKLASPAQLITACTAVLSNDEEPSVRALAASRLARLGVDAASAADALAGAMDDSSEAVRSKAAEALVGLGADALPQLTAKLKSPRAEVRTLAIYSLIAIGRAAKPAEAALTELAQDPDPQVRELAQLAIRRLQGF